jgi:3-phosphoinositide dependent protein kinase-1
LSEKATIFYGSQILDALGYMFKQGLCHRDLKPENFLIDSNFDIQLADFGFCTKIII